MKHYLLRSGRTIMALAIVGFCSFSAVAVSSPVATFADGARAGDATIVDGDSRGKVIDHGRSATRFSLVLPSGAACPGDSLHDQWTYQSFIVPASVDPMTIKFEVNGPTGKDQFALYDQYTASFHDGVTVPNNAPGQPGVIPSLPVFSFATFPPGTLPPGTYRVGIACTTWGRAQKLYWDTQIVVSAAPSDKPGQMVWRLPGVPQAVAEVPSTSSRSWLIAAGVLVVVVGAFVWLRLRNHRPRSRPAQSPETPARVASMASSEESR
jgi:hypothetical protein